MEEGDLERALKMANRTVRISPEMAADAKTMIRLMGVPVIEAAGEAEAQCAEIVKYDKADAVASEDMDTLTFGGKVVLRGFNTKKDPIMQLDLEKILDAFDMD